jgi:hypothetical protein
MAFAFAIANIQWLKSQLPPVVVLLESYPPDHLNKTSLSSDIDKADEKLRPILHIYRRKTKNVGFGVKNFMISATAYY